MAGYLVADPRTLAYPMIEGLEPTPFVSQPPFVLYLFALGEAITGSLETGPVLVSALCGNATIVVVYALGVRLHGRVVGAEDAFFLAMVPMHVHLTRKARL